MIPAAALATVTTALETVLLDDLEAGADPIYDDPDFATEFFATCEQDFASLVADPDYAALVGLFATHLLPKTGSRPVQRQGGRRWAARGPWPACQSFARSPTMVCCSSSAIWPTASTASGRAAEKDRDDV